MYSKQDTMFQHEQDYKYDLWRMGIESGDKPSRQREDAPTLEQEQEFNARWALSRSIFPNVQVK